MPAKNPLSRKIVIPAKQADLVKAFETGMRVNAQVGDITMQPMVDGKPVNITEYVICGRLDNGSLVELSGVEASPYKDPAKAAAAQAKKDAKKADKAAKKAATTTTTTTNAASASASTEAHGGKKSAFGKGTSSAS